MKPGYNTIPQEGESESLISAGIPETGGSRITKKHQVLFALGLVFIGFLMAHRTNTHHLGVRMSKEFVAAQLADSGWDPCTKLETYCEKDNNGVFRDSPNCNCYCNGGTECGRTKCDWSFCPAKTATDTATVSVGGIKA